MTGRARNSGQKKRAIGEVAREKEVLQISSEELGGPRKRKDFGLQQDQGRLSASDEAQSACLSTPPPCGLTF